MEWSSLLEALYAGVVSERVSERVSDELILAPSDQITGKWGGKVGIFTGGLADRRSFRKSELPGAGPQPGNKK